MTPNQRINTTNKIELSTGNDATIEAGSFVRIVNWDYLPRWPRHVFADRDREYYVLAYTQFGFALIKREYVDLRG